MPYLVVQRDGKWVVITKATGKVHGTHKSRRDALAQMRAMYANSGPEAKEKKS